MDSLTDQIRKAYEDYILTPEPSKAISQLVPDSDHQFFLTLLHQIKEKGSMDNTKLEEYRKRFSYSQGYQAVNFMKLVLAYDLAKSDKDKEKAINDLNSNHFGFSFDFQKPRYAKQGEEEKKAALDPNKSKFAYADHYNESNYLNEFYQEHTSFDGLHASLIPELDFSKFHINSLERFIGQYELFDIEQESFYKKLKEWYDQRRKDNTYWNISIDILRKFTLVQLEKIGGMISHLKSSDQFLGVKLEKTFAYELDYENNTNVFSIEEKIVNLQKIMAHFKMPDSHGLTVVLIWNILCYGLVIDSYDQKMFEKYIKNPITYSYLHYSNHSGVGEYFQQFISNASSDIAKRGYHSCVKEVYQRYIEHFYLKGTKLDAIQKVFDKNHFENIIHLVKFYNGEDLTKQGIDPKKYNQIFSNVNIQIADFNRSHFKKKDKVALTLFIKNVPQLFVKIFEFNTEAYYRKHLSTFKSDVNLDGLVASFEQEIKFENPPQKKVRHDFNFDYLDNKTGMFVIEFIGNGFSSRAMIKKGNLSFVHKATIAGHIGYIIDEDREICKGDNTGVVFNGKYFKTDTEKGGRVVIPYERSQQTNKAILIHNDFAQLSDFTRQTEQYELKCSFAVNAESVLMGTKTHLIVRPNLLINGRTAPLSLLKKSKVTLTTTSFIDNIPQTKVFDDLKITESNELQLEFQIPPNLEKIHASFTSEVQNITKGINESFAQDHTFQLNTHKNDQQFIEAFMHRQNGEYTLEVLGKNGEPKSTIYVTFLFAHKIFVNSHPQVTLQTDQKGRIYLGALKDILLVKASIKDFNNKVFERDWKIIDDHDSFIFPSDINLLEGESLQLPVNFDKPSRNNVAVLRQAQDGKVIQDMFKEIVVEKQGSQLQMNLRNLKAGIYIVHLKQQLKNVRVTVHQGNYWQNAEFILKSDSLMQNNERPEILNIESVTLPDKNSRTIKVKVANHTQDCRVHILASQYLPHDSYNSFQALHSTGLQNISTVTFPFPKWKNIFLSDRQLGDEYRYVFDRKQEKRYVGNTLERPRLLLKRNLIGDTDFDTEQVGDGGAYAAHDLNDMMAAPTSSAAYGGAMGMQRKMHKRAYVPQLNAPTNIHEFYYNDMRQIQSFQNFLKNPPLQFFNLKPNQNGEVSITIPDDAPGLEQFSNLHILAVDSSTSTQKIMDIPGCTSDFSHRNLALSDPYNSDKNYTETRNISGVKKLSNITISDITSTEFQIIDSTKQLNQVLQEILKLDGKSNTEFTEKFQFLMTWDALTEEQKNEKLTEFSSHELHFFIYKKDKEYFEKVVKPYIANKMEKTFMDYYLLGDVKHLEQLATNTSSQLNTLESLLLTTITATPAPSTLSSLSQSHPTSHLNRIFDTILHLNSLSKLKDEVGEIKKLQVEEKRQEIEKVKGLQQLFGRRSVMAAPASPTTASAPPPPIVASMRQAMPQKKKKAKQRTLEIKEKYSAMDDCLDELENVGCAFDEGIDDLKELRQVQRKEQFQELEKTREYCEMHYHNIKKPSEFSNLVKPNPFWVEYAKHLLNTPNEPFLPENFIYATGSLTELIAALAIIDLPFSSSSHGFKTTSGRGVEIKPASNVILFKKEIRESQASLKSQILAVHRIYDLDTPQEEEEIVEYLTNKVYGCEVIITNISQRSQNFQILWQIPEGSLPLAQTSYQKSQPMNLSSYTTNKFNFTFYFPDTGYYQQFPSNIAIDGLVVAKAQKMQLNVIREEDRQVFNKSSFKDLIATGSHDDIIDFIKKYNLLKQENNFSFDQIQWLLKDKTFYHKCIDVLRERKIFTESVWLFSIHHKDPQGIRELFKSHINHNNVSLLGPHWNSELVDNYQIHEDWRHLDYFPLVNSRAHKLRQEQSDVSANSNKSNILNRNFRNTYDKFLTVLLRKKKISSSDKLQFVYYFLLQDRLNDALSLFSSISIDKFDQTLKMQYEYMAAYFDFYTGKGQNYAKAREISQRYLDYPNLAWRMMFKEIQQQLKEVDGEEVKSEDAPEIMENIKAEKQQRAHVVEPQFSMQLEGSNVLIDYVNLKSVHLKFYLIDVEVLFSRTPFEMKNTSDFAYVKPSFTANIDLDGQESTHVYPIPAQYANSNIIIEGNAKNKVEYQTYYPTSLRVTIFEQYGEVKVQDKSLKSLPSVYVKVFMKENSGKVSFFKDGYTDIRGKFEYAKTNSKNLSDVTKFAMFIQHDELGSVTKEAIPPSNVSR